MSGFKSNHELISDNMLKSLTIAGTPDQCILQLQKFRDTGVDLPTIQFNPVGDVIDSFKLFTNTFSEER
jgi:alkanesulfonate monooxygenase SsuD/methylene tetrahydromethanopterin reductase-like flavin-dependent oxidoreductase (luciferase family)